MISIIPLEFLLVKIWLIVWFLLRTLSICLLLQGSRIPSIDVPTALWQTVKTDYYAPGLHDVMTGSISVADFLKNIETEGNRILNP